MSHSRWHFQARCENPTSGKFKNRNFNRELVAVHRTASLKKWGRGDESYCKIENSINSFSHTWNKSLAPNRMASFLLARTEQINFNQTILLIASTMLFRVDEFSCRLHTWPRSSTMNLVKLPFTGPPAVSSVRSLNSGVMF